MGKRKFNKMKLTKWCYPTERVDSEYGRIPYSLWMEKEIVRLDKGNNVKHEIVQNKEKFIAIFAKY